MIFYEEPNQILYCGHALEVLKGTLAESVDMVMTSPPYWGLRTYKTEPQIWGDNHCEHEWGITEKTWHSGTNAGQIQLGDKGAFHNNFKNQSAFCLKCNAWRGELGLEPTIELYISHLIQIFDEVKRVLKKTGTCWVVIDDSYASGKGTCFNPGGGKGSFSGHGDRKDAGAYPLDRGNVAMLKAEGLLPKSLCLIPQRFAIAMVEQGWILRNDIVWNKPNPMPESVKDRFTGSWEHLFFFTKNNQALYWTNSKTFKITDKQPLGTHGIENEDWKWIEHSSCEGKGCNNKRCVNGKIKSSLWEGHDYWFEQQFEPVLPQSLERERYGWNGAFRGRYDVPWEKRTECLDQSYTNPLGRNKRDVWEITTQPYPEAHFATFPEKLCEIPVLAGCPGAICKKCGKVREKIYRKGFTDHTGKTGSKSDPTDKTNNGAYGRLALLRQAAREQGGEYVNDMEFMGYTDCGCNAGFEPGVVIDLFCGSGTVLAVAKKLGRKAIGVDLSSKYCGLTVKRLQGISLPMELI